MSQESDRWKGKYLDLIDDHEKLEKSFQDHSTELRRALIRLTVVAEGRDPDLDTQLSATRDLLRKDQLTGLNRILEKIENGFERWQDHQESFHTQLAESMVSIETEFDTLPSSFTGALKKVRKQVRSVDKAELLLAMVSVLAQWAQEMVAQFEGEGDTESPKNEEQKDDKPSWFSRLFANDNTDADGNNNSEITDNSANQNYQIDEQDDKQAGLNSLSLEASKVLTGLISKLSLPNQEQPRALRLLTKVKVGLNWYELVPALEILADLVLSALGTEQEEFEAFLKNLNERLLALQEWLSTGENLESNFKEASSDFDLKMRQHLEDLKNVLAANNSDASTLKGSASQQLDDVFATLDGFKLEQRSREIAFESHIKELAKRIQSMESELIEAQEQLSKSQLKAMTDSLTGLPNRGAYDIYIEKEYERFRRYDGDLSILVCDVDKFKNINDSYGHQAGDKVLQLISRQVKKGTRDTDLLSRYGGEEFVVILPETDAQAAFLVGEKIREQVAGSPFHFKGKRVQITISCGIAAFKTGYRPEQVFDAADKALYKAKEGGRNQCQIGELEGSPGEEPE